jgi:hypothetical protein
MSVTAKALINSKFASDAVVAEYTAPAATRTIIDKFTATNTDGSVAKTISIYLVPSGSTAGPSNQIVDAKSLAALQCYEFSTELKNHVLAAGDSICVVAASASTVNIRASGRECT